MTRRRGRIVVATLCAGLGLGLASGAAPAQEQASGCVTCHEEESPAIVQAHRGSVHAKLGCVACHGGDAAATTASGAHDAVRSFRGKLDATRGEQECAGCHGDAARMHPYGLDHTVAARWTGGAHGAKAGSGGFKAGCSACHGVHDVRSHRDPQSPTHHRNVPATCAKCHADAEKMAGSKLPLDQGAEYAAGAHGRLLASEDFSESALAPSCVDCHGAHGSAPPDAVTVPAVCKNCHFEEHRYMTSGAHYAALRHTGSPSCVDCHGNHKTTMPATIAKTCGGCHEPKNDPAHALALRLETHVRQTKADLAGLERAIAARTDRMGPTGKRLLAAELTRIRGIQRHVMRVSHSLRAADIDAALGALADSIATARAVTATDLDDSAGFGTPAIVLMLSGIVLAIVVATAVVARILIRVTQSRHQEARIRQEVDG